MNIDAEIEKEVFRSFLCVFVLCHQWVKKDLSNAENFYLSFSFGIHGISESQKK